MPGSLVAGTYDAAAEIPVDCWGMLESLTRKYGSLYFGPEEREIRIGRVESCAVAITDSAHISRVTIAPTA